MKAFDQSWLPALPGKVARRGPQDLIPLPWRVFWLPMCMVLTLLLIRAVTPQATPVQGVDNRTPEQCGDKPAAMRVGQADAVRIVPMPQSCNVQVTGRG